MDEWQTLDDIAPGSIFVTTAGVRAVKTEYYNNENPHPMCILLGSGEYAHFPDRERTRVRVLDLYRAGLEDAARRTISVANDIPADVDDGFYAGYKQACRNAIAAIRALAG